MDHLNHLFQNVLPYPDAVTHRLPTDVRQECALNLSLTAMMLPLWLHALPILSDVRTEYADQHVPPSTDAHYRSPTIARTDSVEPAPPIVQVIPIVLWHPHSDVLMDPVFHISKNATELLIPINLPPEISRWLIYPRKVRTS
jgi:hypothetical protein